MPLVQIDLTESEHQRLSDLSLEERRSMRQQGAIYLMERIEQVEAAKASDAAAAAALLAESKLKGGAK